MKVSLQEPLTWTQISAYLDQALELDPGEQEIWLEQLTTTQPQIARTVRKLLDEREALNAEGFLANSLPLPTDIVALKPALQDKLPLPASPSSVASNHRLEYLSAGVVLGAYRLIREIGQGGMSTVWLAERCDGQLKREVALKLPIAGPQRMQLTKRFQRERDILAALTHPNIAHVYDAGVSGCGQSYLAMEYIEGTSLIDYCDAARLPLRTRLRLFEQVLAAVQFAHSRLVIHRDLKPSNILVTAQQRVVLLDFGIAKLLIDNTEGAIGAAANASQLTQMAGRALTPDYASPEQIAGQPLGTATDVYSLGVLLFELVTGQRPYQLQRDSRGALEEAIISQAPARPSQVLVSETQALYRGSTARKLVHALKGDLDTIILKALKKNPNERYVSVEAFAQDITNYLHSVPVNARPDSHWYQLNRFVVRHKWSVSAVALIVLAIVGGAAAATWQAQTAAQERDRAVALASRNAAINEFTAMLIAEAAASENPVTVSEMLARSEKLALADTNGNTENRAAILGMIAGHYQSLANNGKSAQLLEQALALIGSSRDISLRSRLICDHAVAISGMGQSDAAIRAITAQLGDVQSDPESAAHCLRNRANIAAQIGDGDGALRDATLALNRLHELSRIALVDEGSLLGLAAYGYRLNGHIEQANHYFELALQKYIDAGRDRSPDAMSLRNNWAMVSNVAGVPKRALELYRQTLSIATESNPAGNPPAALIYNRARSLESIGRYREARDDYELGLLLSAQQKDAHAQINCLLGLASVAEQTHDQPSAAQYLERTLRLNGIALPADSPPMIRRELIQGKLQLAAGKLDEARAAFNRVLEMKRKNPTALDATLGKAEVDLLEGNSIAAVRNAQAAVDLATSLQGGVQHSNYAGLAWLMLGRALQKGGETAPAHQAFENALSHLSATVDADHPAIAQARQLMSDVS